MADITYGSSSTFYESTGNINPSQGVQPLADIDATHHAIAFYTENKLIAKIGTLSGDTISYGSNYTIVEDGTSCSNISAVALDSTHVLFVWQREYYSESKSVIGTISNGNELSFGTIYSGPSDYRMYTCVKKIDSTHFLIGYANQNDNYTWYSAIGTVSNGNEIAYGTAYATVTYGHYSPSFDLLDSTHFVHTWFISSENKMGAVIGTINGTEITYGTEYKFTVSTPTFHASQGSGTNCVVALSSSKFVFSYAANEDSTYTCYSGTVVGTISNVNEISFGDENIWEHPMTTLSYMTQTSMERISDSKFLLAYSFPGGYYQPNTDPTARVCTVSSSTVTYGDECVMYDGNILGQGMGSALLSTTEAVFFWVGNAYPSVGYIINGNIATGSRTSAPLPMFRRSV